MEILSPPRKGHAGLGPLHEGQELAEVELAALVLVHLPAESPRLYAAGRWARDPGNPPSRRVRRPRRATAQGWPDRFSPQAAAEEDKATTAELPTAAKADRSRTSPH